MSCPNAALALLKETAQHQQISGFWDKPKIQVFFSIPSFLPSLFSIKNFHSSDTWMVLYGSNKNFWISSSGGPLCRFWSRQSTMLCCPWRWVAEQGQQPCWFVFLTVFPLSLQWWLNSTSCHSFLVVRFILVWVGESVWKLSEVLFKWVRTSVNFVSFCCLDCSQYDEIGWQKDRFTS